MPPLSAWLPVLAFAFTLIGCSDDESNRKDDPSPTNATAAQPPRARFHNLPDDSPSESFDVNGDGNNDQSYFRQGGDVIRVERDVNFDGRPDLFEHYERGQIVEEELDLDFDGQMDAVKFFRDGQVDHRQYAIAFKEHLVITSWYDGSGNLVRIERDTNEDNRIDTWEHYNPGQKEPYRIEIDYDGDERPDDTLLGDAPAQGG